MGIWHRQFLAWHPVVGWWFIPNLKAIIPHGDNPYLLRTNSIGMRSDREYPKTPPKGRRRILVLGDSYTAGDGVENGVRFSDLLENTNPNLDVLNFGLPGSGTDQQLLVYETMAKPFEVDAYVFATGIENILRNQVDMWPARERGSDTVWFMPKPFFTLEGDSLLLHNQPVPAQRISQREALKRRGIAYALEEMDAAAPKWMQRVNAFRRISISLQKPYQGYESENSPSWRLMRAIIEKLLDEVRGKPVLILPPPTDHFCVVGLAPTYLARFAVLHDPSKLVYVHDALPDFKQLSPEYRKKCFISDGHYSELGHKVIAGAISKAIAQHCPDMLN